MAFSFAKTYNTEKLFDIDTDGFEYKSLEELLREYDEDEIFPVCGLYINTKGKYDDAPVIATDDCYVNLPSHLTKMVQEILKDSRAIQAIRDGKVGFTIYQYENTRYSKDCFSIKWVDR